MSNQYVKEKIQTKLSNFQKAFSNYKSISTKRDV